MNFLNFEQIKYNNLKSNLNYFLSQSLEKYSDL